MVGVLLTHWYLCQNKTQLALYYCFYFILNIDHLFHRLHNHWIGLSDLHTRGTLRWLDGIALQSMWPGTWSSDSLSKGSERCVMFMNQLEQDQSLVFDDKLCSIVAKAICQSFVKGLKLFYLPPKLML